MYFLVVRRWPDALRRAPDVVMPHYLVDDEAFPLSRHLMRPCPRAGQVGPEADDRRIFQLPPESCAGWVENAFGIMSQRFRIYRGTPGCTPKRAQKLVRATCALHNFLGDRELQAKADAGAGRGSSPALEDGVGVTALREITDHQGWSQHPHPSGGPYPGDADGLREWRRQHRVPA